MENQKTLTPEEEIEALKAQNATLQANLEAKDKAIESAVTENATLQAKLEAKEDQIAAIDPTVKHDKSTYRVMIPKFRLNGKDYTFETLKDDKAAIELLVETGSGVLQKIEK